MPRPPRRPPRRPWRFGEPVPIDLAALSAFGPPPVLPRPSPLPPAPPSEQRPPRPWVDVRELEARAGAQMNPLMPVLGLLSPAADLTVGGIQTGRALLEGKPGEAGAMAGLTALAAATPLSVPRGRPGRDLFARLRREGGFTLRPDLTVPTIGTSHLIADPALTQTLSAKGAREINAFLARPDVVAALERPGARIGGWYDPVKGTGEINISHAELSEPVGRALGVLQSQRAIGRTVGGAYTGDIPVEPLTAVTERVRQETLAKPTRALPPGHPERRWFDRFDVPPRPRPITGAEPPSLDALTEALTREAWARPRARIEERVPRTAIGPEPSVVQPRDVYHGTQARGIVKPTMSHDIGPHVGTPGQAADRLLGTMEAETIPPIFDYPRGSTVIPLRDYSTRPVVLPYDPVGWSPPAIAEALLEAKIATRAEARAMTDYDTIRDFLRKKGYDSIEYPNQFEAAGWSGGAHGVGDPEFAPSRAILDPETNLRNRLVEPLPAILGGTPEQLAAREAARATSGLRPPVPRPRRLQLDDILPYLTESERARVLKNKQLREDVVTFSRQLGPDDPLVAAVLRGQYARGGYASVPDAAREAFGDDANRFLAIWASVSPRQLNENAIPMAQRILTAWRRAGNGQPLNAAQAARLARKYAHLPARVPNVVAALTTADPAGLALSGPKVGSFYPNIRGEPDPVTLDAIQGAAMGVDPNRWGQLGPYLAGSAQVRRVGEQVGRVTGVPWTPAETQESMWSTARALMNLPGAERGVRTGALPEMTERVTPALAGEQWGPGMFGDIVAGQAPQARRPALAFPTGDPAALSEFGRRVQRSMRGKYLFELAGLLGLGAAAQGER